MVFENANQGTDAVFASVNYTLTANVEALVLQAAGNLSGTGNGLGNAIFGNSGDNVLDGQGGADILTGNAGNDTFIFITGQSRRRHRRGFHGERRARLEIRSDPWVTVLAQASPTSMQPIGR